jgi:hypothetical protein
VLWRWLAPILSRSRRRRTLDVAHPVQRPVPAKPKLYRPAVVAPVAVAPVAPPRVAATSPAQKPVQTLISAQAPSQKTQTLALEAAIPLTTLTGMAMAQDFGKTQEFGRTTYSGPLLSAASLFAPAAPKQLDDND